MQDADAVMSTEGGEADTQSDSAVEGASAAGVLEPLVLRLHLDFLAGDYHASHD